MLNSFLFARADNNLATSARTFTAGGNVSATAGRVPDVRSNATDEMEMDETSERFSTNDQIEGWTYSDDVQDKGRTWTHAEDRFLWQIYRRYNEDELADIAKLVLKILVC